LFFGGKSLTTLSIEQKLLMDKESTTTQGEEQ